MCTSASRQVSFAGHRSQVTGHNHKAHSKTLDVRITRDSQEVYRCFHATNPMATKNVLPYNFNEKIARGGICTKWVEM